MSTCAIDLSPASPCSLTVRVLAGMPWTSPSMTRADSSVWPAGLRLVFAGDSTGWPATVSGDGLTATIAATSAQVDALTNGQDATLRDDDSIYATGNVWVKVVPL